jgi:hypothetical protein
MGFITASDFAHEISSFSRSGEELKISSSIFIGGCFL